MNKVRTWYACRSVCWRLSRRVQRVWFSEFFLCFL